MADYYTQGSVTLTLPEGQLSEIAEIFEEVNDAPDNETSEILGAAYCGGQAYEYVALNGKPPYLSVACDTGFNPSLIGDAIAHVLKKHNSNEVVTVTWASVCSKLRPDAFSGGALVASRLGVSFMDASEWAGAEAERVIAWVKP